MSSEDGGVGTTSSRIRRTLSRRGGLRRTTRGCFAAVTLRAAGFPLAGRRGFGAVVAVRLLPERFDPALRGVIPALLPFGRVFLCLGPALARLTLARVAPVRFGAAFRDRTLGRPPDLVRRGAFRLAR
jgi:hypothetical protein